MRATSTTMRMQPTRQRTGGLSGMVRVAPVATPGSASSMRCAARPSAAAAVRVVACALPQRGSRLAPTPTAMRRLQASPMLRRGRGRTNAVSVQANLFARMARLFRSFIENTVQSVEDPERLLDTVVGEMQDDLIKMRQAAAQVLASQKMVEGKYKQAQVTADEWLRRAELAVTKGEDELAKEALRRRKALQDQADILKKQVAAQTQAVDQLMTNTRVLETKIAEARSKKQTLKARAASAKTSKQIQEMISGLNTSNSVVAFEKMEEKVMALEAEAEGTGLLLANDNALENKFAALEAGTVNDELAALKKGMLRAPASAPARPSTLPEGRPIRDAIDFELETLRRRVLE